MEKYAKLIKGLEACAGPDCCGEHCPYYGETRGGKTCRAWLLHDAAAAIANEEAGSETLQELLHNTEAERDKLAEECEGLKEYALALEKEGQEARVELDKLNQEITCYIQQREQAEADLHVVREQNKNLRGDNEELRKECEALEKKVARITTDRDALRALRCPPKKEADRSSVSDDALKPEYKRGYLDAMEYCFRELCKRAGGGCRHD